MRLEKQTTFKVHGYKRVLCPNCLRFLKETHLIDKNAKEVKCPKCKNSTTIYPPRHGKKDGKSGVFWIQESDSCWTALE